MDLVAPRFHRYIEDTAARLAIFSRVGAGLYRDLLNCIHAWLGLCRNAGRAGVGCFLTLDTERLRVGGSAIDPHQAIRSPRAAWNQLNHRVRIPYAGAAGERATNSQNRKFIQPASRDVVTHLAAFGP